VVRSGSRVNIGVSGSEVAASKKSLDALKLFIKVAQNYVNRQLNIGIFFDAPFTCTQPTHQAPKQRQRTTMVTISLLKIAASRSSSPGISLGKENHFPL
jgi:hypothetical protein